MLLASLSEYVVRFPDRRLRFEGIMYFNNFKVRFPL